MHACTSAEAQLSSGHGVGHNMADWSVMGDWPSDGSYNPYVYGMNTYYQDKPPLPPYFPPPRAQQFLPPAPVPPPRVPLPPTPSPSPALTVLLSPQQQQSPTMFAPGYADYSIVPRAENPREIRNKAEKQRRDKLNHSISELASMVPPVVAANRKIDKTGVLRLTAHYLRAHQYVFGDSIGQPSSQFNPAAAQALLSLLRGFLITTTYKGLIVVVSQNVQQYLGYAELDLLGQNVFNITHPDDHQILRDNLMPKSHLLGPNGELLVPDDPEGSSKIAQELAGEKRRFIVRFKKHSLRSEPAQYVKCYIEGTLRKSDRATRGYSRCCQVVRRARARGDNPCSSGNDVVFIGLARTTTETFISETQIESFRMEYRTRHSVDGEIVDVEPRIAIVTGYMSHEVNGVNAMNFIHRDDVRWVIFNLRDMYDQHRLVGESCYRLIAKNGQIIYMKTVGRLDVDEDSRAVTSFACLNTVVDEQEGKHLIKLMKKKCMIMVNNNGPPTNFDVTDLQNPEDQSVTPFEDPKNLEKVILHLVTDLPSIHPTGRNRNSTDEEDSSLLPLAIIPPKKERILGAIEKIYDVINNLTTITMSGQDRAGASENLLRPEGASTRRKRSPSRSPARLSQPRMHTLFKRQLEGLGDSRDEVQPLRLGFSSTGYLQSRPKPSSTFANPDGHQFRTPAPKVGYPSHSAAGQVHMPTAPDVLVEFSFDDQGRPESKAKKVKRGGKSQGEQQEPQDSATLSKDNEQDNIYPFFDEYFLEDPYLDQTIKSLEINIDHFPDLLGRDVTSIIEEMEEERSPEHENE